MPPMRTPALPEQPDPAPGFDPWRWVGADAPDAERPGPAWGAYGAAVAGVGLVTLAAWPVATRVAESTLIMAFLLATLLVALRGDRGAAIATAVLSVGAYDFFFVPPYWTLRVADVQQVFTFGVMGLMGTGISALTARLAAELAETRRRERRSRALHELSRSLLAAREPAEALADGARVLGAAIGRPPAAWLRGPGEELRAVVAPEPPLDAAEQALLRDVLLHGRAAGPGPNQLWLFVPIRTEARVHGGLGLRLDPAEAGHATGLRAALETGANQIAVALDQARAREEAEAARRLAEGERLRSALLSAVSHDLRTPLTGIVGAAGVLAEGAESLSVETRRELAQGIVEEGGRLGRLMTNLLHASRLEGGAPALDRSWYPLEEVLEPALAGLAGPLAGRQVEVKLSAGLPLVHVDATIAGQVFANLLENACRHTPAGTAITVRAAAEGPWVVVTVSDAGPGLPAGCEARLFEGFRRGSARADGGTGLGLSIVKAAVEAHGGQVTASRAPEGGASFRFSLPAPPPPGEPGVG